MSTNKKNQNKNVTEDVKQTSEKNVKEEVKQASEKTMTKYERKMAAYKQQQAKEARERVITRAVVALVVVLLIAFIASFPIRTLIAINQTMFTINGEKVTRVELDYQYAVARTNYLNSYGNYLSMFGYTDLTNIDSQVYTEDMTFGDYFQQLAVEGITNNRALLKEAAQEGFTYDTTEEYNTLMDTLIAEAKEQDVTLNKYIKALFGQYASKSVLKPIQEKTLLSAAYYNEVQKRKAPDDATVESYYQEHKQDYDSVDFYILTVDADLNIDHIDSTDYEGDEEPTEEEIEAAMKIAYAKAEEKMAVVEKEGELQENVLYSDCSDVIRDYLFDEERKAGDSEIFEDMDNHTCQVVKFVKRYLSQQNTVDMYAIIVDEDEDPEAVLNEWKSRGETEDNFKALAKEYAAKTQSTSEGYFEGIDASTLEDELADWLLDASRQKGDNIAIKESGYGYIVYYLGTNKPVYYQDIKGLLTSQNMNDYMETLTRDANVQDPDENLAYLHIPTETAFDEGLDGVEVEQEDVEAGEAEAE